MLPSLGLTNSIFTWAVKTYLSNDRKNDPKEADPSNPKLFGSLIDGDITAPGFMGLPVCDENLALKNWKMSTWGDPIRKKLNFPCLDVDHEFRCDPSTYEDQTSDASPPTSDCKKMLEELKSKKRRHVDRVEGHAPQDSHVREVHLQVYAETGGSNSHFFVGYGDVIEILEQAIEIFDRDGKIRAKGTMECGGDLGSGSDAVEWGLF